MNIIQLRQLLEVHGADLSSWPDDRRVAAQQLITADPAAADAHVHATRLDALINGALARSPTDDAAATASALRVAAALSTRQLPRQHRTWRWWPAELAAFDFAPAWPRIAALAGVAALGFLVGLVGLGGTFAGSFAFTQPASAEPDVSAIVFDPESITGLRP